MVRRALRSSRSLRVRFFIKVAYNEIKCYFSMLDLMQDLNNVILQLYYLDVLQKFRDANFNSDDCSIPVIS